MKLTHIQVMIQTECIKLEYIFCCCLKAEGLFFLLIYCMFRYSYKITTITKYSRGHENFVKITKNADGGWQPFFKNTGGERVKNKVQMFFFSFVQCYSHFGFPN